MLCSLREAAPSAAGFLVYEVLAAAPFTEPMRVPGLPTTDETAEAFSRFALSGFAGCLCRVGDNEMRFCDCIEHLRTAHQCDPGPVRRWDTHATVAAAMCGGAWPWEPRVIPTMQGQVGPVFAVARSLLSWRNRSSVCPPRRHVVELQAWLRANPPIDVDALGQRCAGPAAAPAGHEGDGAGSPGQDEVPLQVHRRHRLRLGGCVGKAFEPTF